MAVTIGELADSDRSAQRIGDAAAGTISDDIDLVVAELQSTLITGDHPALRPSPSGRPGTDADADPGTVDADRTDSADGDALTSGAGTAGAGDTDTDDTDSGDTDTDTNADPPPTEATDTDSVEASTGLSGTVADDEPDPRPVDEIVVAAEITVVEQVIAAGADPDDEPEDGPEDGPEATVHDLFARLRADVDEPVDVDAVADAHEPDDVDRVGAPAVDGLVAADPVQAALDLRDSLLAPAEKSLARVLKRLVSDEQNEVLDRLRRLPKRSRPDLTTLLSEFEDVSRFAEALGPDFALAVTAGSRFWIESGGVSSGSLLEDDPAVSEALNFRVGELLGIRRAHLQKTLDAADDEGLELAELGDRMRTAYRDWRSTAVAERAGDLATAGFAEGVRAAAGPDSVWAWLPDNGGLPCADAEDNSLAGAVSCGEKFPTGDVLPPAHSGCRCILVPRPH